MKRIALALLAVSSTFICACKSVAELRPHYGGTVRVAIRGTAASLDPAVQSSLNDLEQRNVSRLIFDTLVTLDDKGNPQPWLATSWSSDGNGQHWMISIRRGVKFQDGSEMTPDAVAMSLQFANPKWKVNVSGESITVETETPAPNLPAELALSHNSIAKRGAQLVGTGPFAVSGWQPGTKLTLTAFEQYWHGRPYVDSIEIQIGKSYRDQMLQLDTRAADVIEVAPEQALRAAAEGRTVVRSAPTELMALVFSHDPQSEDEAKLREALGYAIDRQALNAVLLQGTGVPSASLLPDWLSGYGFLFPTAPDLARARQLRGLIPAPTWTLSYDTGDPLSRVIAERVALNAQDVGLRLQPSNSASSDMRLVRAPLKSLDAALALNLLRADLHVGVTDSTSQSPQTLYQAEVSVLQSRRVVPLMHAPATFAISGSIKSWTESRDGLWRMENVWLEKP